ncbi:unnamed protein product [Larinioides sclopetarius]|uniref:Uncharacterized protein n=1 Tax=Larinioides sclopetarius TaxID=280406 RepID=A0AAV2AS45_9ARAC
MASEYRPEGDRECFDDGHLIVYSVELPIAAPPCYFSKSFTFHCSVSPTSWSFFVNFEKKPTDGSVSCHVVIRRTDEDRNRIDVDFWMAAFCSDPIVDLPPKTINLRGMPGGREARRTFDGFLPYEIARQIGDRPRLFQVSLGVHGCHRGERRKSLAKIVNWTHEKGKFKMLESKL